jgi:hypothetical protein
LVPPFGRRTLTIDVDKGASMTDELPEQAEPELAATEKKQDEAPAGPPPQIEGSISGTGQTSKRNRGVVTSAWQRLLGRRG